MRVLARGIEGAFSRMKRLHHSNAGVKDAVIALGGREQNADRGSPFRPVVGFLRQLLDILASLPQSSQLAAFRKRHGILKPFLPTGLTLHKGVTALAVGWF